MKIVSSLIRISIRILAVIGFLFLAALSISYFRQYHHLGIQPEDYKFLKEAYRQAEIAYKEGEAPVGAVTVVDGVITSRAHNRVFEREDPHAHAEIIAINKLLKKIKRRNFRDYKKKVTVYSSYEPCQMCEGYMKYCSVDRVVWAHSKGHSDGWDQYLKPNLRYWLTSIGGAILPESPDLMPEWKKTVEEFKEKRRESQ